MHEGLQRQQLAVGAEGVEIRIVSREGSACFRGALRTSRAAVFEALALSGIVRDQRRQQFGFIVREIQVHSHVRGQRHQRHQIGGLHLCVDEFLRGFDGSLDLFRIHRRNIKKEQNQSPVARVQRRRRFLGGAQQRARPGCTRDDCFRGAGGCQLVYILEIESGNLLLLPILKDRKVSLFQIANEVPLLVVCDHIHQHEFTRDLDARFVRSGLSGLLGKHRRRLQEQPPCCEERKCLSRNPHIHLPSEPEARLHCHAPHAARPCDLPECK